MNTATETQVKIEPALEQTTVPGTEMQADGAPINSTDSEASRIMPQTRVESMDIDNVASSVADNQSNPNDFISNHQNLGSTEYNNGMSQLFDGANTNLSNPVSNPDDNFMQM